MATGLQNLSDAELDSLIQRYNGRRERLDAEAEMRTTNTLSQISNDELLSILEAEGEQLPTVEDERGFFTRVGDDLEKRYGNMRESARMAATGEQTTVENILQTTGQVAGAAMDVIGEGLVSAVRYIADATPDELEETIVANAKELWEEVLDTDIGKRGVELLSEGSEVYQDFREENPRAARNIEAVANIGLLLAPVKKGAPSKADASTLRNVSGYLDDLATKQAQGKREGFVKDLLLPEQLKKQRVQQAGRTVEKGILRTKEVVPTAQEKSVIRIVSQLDSVKPSNSIQGNLNAIKTEMAKEADSLVAQLKKNDVIFPKSELKAKLSTAIKELADEPLIVGDAAKTAQKITNKAQEIIGRNKGSASGMLKARKELDNFMKRTFGDKIYDDKIRAANVANAKVRNTLNDFLAEKAKNVKVKDSLSKQSNLFRALDVLEPKAAAEGANRIARAVQAAANIVPIKNEAASLAALGLGGAGAGFVATTLPALAGTGLVGAGLYKGLTSAKTKRAASALLKGIDSAIKKTKDKNILNELRLGRAALVESIEGAENDDNR